MDVLCVDKTGTITMNQLAVTGLIPLGQSKDSDVLFAGALASEEANQDPLTWRFLRRRANGTSSTVFPRSSQSRSSLSMRKTGGPRPSSNRMGSVFE